MKAVYPVILEQEKDFIVASVSDLAITTQGKDYFEAIAMARDAIGLIGITEEDYNKSIPVPSKAKDIALKEGQILTLVDVDFADYRRKNDRKSEDLTAIEYRHTVSYYETDKMGITHHSNYIRWMEEARIDFLSKIGWPMEKIEEAGITSPVVSVECRYKKPSTFPDTIRIKVRPESLKGVRLFLKYSMTKEDGSLICEGRSEHCFLKENGRPIAIQKELPELAKFLVAPEKC